MSYWLKKDEKQSFGNLSAQLLLNENAKLMHS